MQRAAAILSLASGLLMAQAPGPRHVLRGLLVDPSNAAVPQAQIHLRSPGGEWVAATDGVGQFRFEDVTPGNYEIEVSVAGFDPIRRNVRIGNRPPQPLTLRLRIAPLKEELTVAAPELRISTDIASNVDVISVERTMLDKLPFLDLDYMTALSRFLDSGTPGDAGTSVIVDGMEMRKVGVTPSAIQEIRIHNNAYTAEYPRWSRRRIEVITKSSADSYHGTFNFLFRDYHLDARNAFALRRPQEQRRIFEGSLFGPVGRSKNTSFLLSAAREDEDLVAVVFAQGLQGPIRENVPAPTVNTVASLRVSHQLSNRQSMFWQVNFQDRWQNNIGVGGTTLREAGAQSRFREDELIFNHRVALQPKLLSQFRILLGRYWAPRRSNLSAPRIVVTDAFTGGGSQLDRLSTEVHTSITWLLAQNIGKHALKYGFNVPDWSRRGLVDLTDQIGTLSFASLQDYAANRPFAAVVQRGDPKLIFVEKNLGGFFQDEWQLRPNLSVAAGLRYDWQNHFGDRNNVAPRLAVAYGPGKQKRFVIRSGAGFFFERSGPMPVWDILRYNGVRQRRYVLTGPQVAADLLGLSLDGVPISVHRLERGIELPNAMQFSAGFESQLAKKTTLAVNYVGTRAVQQLRSRDANAPLPPDFAARPDSRFNVLRHIESAGLLQGNSLEITLRGELAPRVNGTAQYVFGKTMTDTGGVNWFPANSFDPRGEWGRTDLDRRHQFNLLATASLRRWANFGVAVSLQSGVPFNITTGRDDNRDGMAIDRPPCGSRNTGLGPGFAGVDLRWYREVRFAPAKKDKSPSVTASVDAFNLFNRVNYHNYLGALSSPFFGRSVAAQPPRRLQLGLRLQF